MEQTSIHPPTIPSIHTPTRVPLPATERTAFPLENPNLYCSTSIGVSKRLIREVIAANKTAAKNTTIKNGPPGICLNTSGIVINISGGPEAGFTLREFGVFGRVGEDAALLYYGALGDGAQQIHPLSQGLEVRQYPVALALTAEAEVALTYPPGVFVTQAELEQLGLLRPFGPVAVTIPLSWAGSGPWTQEVAVEGVTADMELLHLSLAKTTDSAAGRAHDEGIVCVT